MSSGIIDHQSNYRVKRIIYLGRKTAICLQNKNGPCPLLAIANTLLLRGNIEIHSDMSYANEEYLHSLLTEYLYRSNSQSKLKDQSEDYFLNQQQNIADVVQLLPRLKRGVDLNVMFYSPESFEFTDVIACFDVFKIRVLHGWLVDPADDVLYTCIGDRSFNHLMDFLVAATALDDGRHVDITTIKPGQPIDDLTKAKVVSNFLESTSSQLTVYGLGELHTTIRENEICIWFRNNHFSTVTKRDGIFYSLVSDMGYMNEPGIVWEAVLGIEGDSFFADGNFILQTSASIMISNSRVKDEAVGATNGSSNDTNGRFLASVNPPTTSSSTPYADVLTNNPLLEAQHNTVTGTEIDMGTGTVSHLPEPSAPPINLASETQHVTGPDFSTDEEYALYLSRLEMSHPESDFALARRLHEEELRKVQGNKALSEAEKGPAASDITPNGVGDVAAGGSGTSGMSDYELAKRLQDEERRKALALRDKAKNYNGLGSATVRTQPTSTKSSKKKAPNVEDKSKTECVVQ